MVDGVGIVKAAQCRQNTRGLAGCFLVSIVGGTFGGIFSALSLPLACLVG